MCRAGGTEIRYAAVTLLQRKSDKYAHGHAVKQLVADVAVPVALQVLFLRGHFRSHRAVSDVL
jgi:hypothetical protein